MLPHLTLTLSPGDGWGQSFHFVEEKTKGKPPSTGLTRGGDQILCFLL